MGRPKGTKKQQRRSVEENKRAYYAQLSYGCSNEEARERTGLSLQQLQKYRFEDKLFQKLTMTEKGKRTLREYADSFLREDLIYLISSTIYEARKALGNEDTELRKLVKLISIFGVKELGTVEKMILDRKKHEDTMTVMLARLELDSNKKTPLQLAQDLRKENRQIIEGTCEVIDE